MLKKVVCRIKGKKHLFRAIVATGLSIMLALGATGCSNNTAPTPSGTVVDLSPSGAGDGTMDVRASAAQTFGGQALVNVQLQSQQTEPEEVLLLTPGDSFMSLTQFIVEFSQSSKAFSEHVMSALNQAGLQTSADNEVIRFDTLANASLFTIFAAWEDGPEATLDCWKYFVGDGNWDLDAFEDDGTIYLLFYKDEVPTAEIIGRWYESDQYLFCVFRTAEYELEMDLLSTDYGFACQLYEPDTPAIYRLSFANDGTWDGGIGCTFAIADQPDVLTGLETLTYAMDWPELEMMQTSFVLNYVLIEGSVMTVAQSGGAYEYTINTNADANEVTHSEPPEDNNYQNAAETISQEVTASQNTLSPEARPYARLWHGSSVLGSGWSERFALYDDGSFIWGANQMDGATRLRFLAGRWDVSGNNLIMTVKLVIGWEGGEVVANPGGSYGSEVVIMNPQIVISQTEEVLTLPLGRIMHDAERNLDTAMFNELQCWDYSAQADEAMIDFWLSFTSLWNRAPMTKDKNVPATKVE